ncbi:MAG: hypothetical protein E6R13_03920 [Spirochaetes bacterium]|nr:MAG: hypothetical protein E6R13_03920 [Spirochaetota bacterium]
MNIKVNILATDKTFTIELTEFEIRYLKKVLIARDKLIGETSFDPDGNKLYWDSIYDKLIKSEHGE